MQDEYRKPLPRPTAISEGFWSAAHDGRFVVQHCTACGHNQHPPRPLCPNCWSDALTWQEASGKATIYAFTIAYRTSTKGFRDDTPYVVAIVETEEGARMTTNIIDCNLADLRIGMPVTAVLVRVTDAVTLVKFTPSTL